MTQSLEKKFEALAKQWYEGTILHSNPMIIFNHPACKKLIALGKPIIPLILENFANEESFDWGYVLTKITGENPCPRHNYRSYNLIRDDWLCWGDKKGYFKYVQASVSLRVL